MNDALVALAEACERAPYHRSLGVRVESLENDRARIRVPYKDENSNPGRALHGGVPASTIGIAGVLAAQAGGEMGTGGKMGTVPIFPEAGTVDLSVNYLAAAIGEDIVAEARVLRRGKEIVYSDVDVRTDAGKAIAKGLVTYRAAPASPPDRVLSVEPEPLPEAREEDIPPMARALVAVPFIARMNMAILLMKGGQSLIEMPARGEIADGERSIHEGALAALLDTTGAMASWSIVGLNLRYKASTVGIRVAYHDKAREEDVVAHGRTLRRMNEIFLNTVTVRGKQSGRIVVTGGVTYRIVVPE